MPPKNKTPGRGVQKRTPKKSQEEKKKRKVLPEWFQGLSYDVYKRILELNPEGKEIVERLQNQ